MIKKFNDSCVSDGNISTWTQQDKNAATYLCNKQSGPNWNQVVRRITINNVNGKIIENLKIHDGLRDKLLLQKLPSGISSITTILYYSSKPFFPPTNTIIPTEAVHKVTLPHSSLNVVLRKRTIKLDLLVQFYHGTFMCPVTVTWIKAIRTGHFLTCKGLDENLVLKHLPPSVNTEKGHSKQERQHLQQKVQPTKHYKTILQRIKKEMLLNSKLTFCLD